jgi:predicted O-methyltransferase YrrM
MDTKVLETLIRIEQEEGVFERNEKQSLPAIEPIKSRFASIPRSTGKLLYSLVLAKQPKQLLEIGSSVGYSTIWLAAGASCCSGHLYSTEVSSVRSSYAQKNIEAAGLKNVTHINKSAFDVIKEYNKPFFDFIFIDSFKKDYPQLLEQSLLVLQKNGLIVFDNILSHYEYLESFVEKIKASTDLQSELLPIDNGLLVIYKN